MPSDHDVFEALIPVMDPEHPISITDPRIQIVTPEQIKVDEDGIHVQFKPTVPYCPMGGLIGVLIRHRLNEVFPTDAVHVSLVPGSHSQEDAVNSMINDDSRYNQIVAQMEERGMI